MPGIERMGHMSEDKKEILLEFNHFALEMDI
jgi:hypothetical protein